MPHLLVAITAHGFGHVAQTAPVINALRRFLPTLRLTLYTSLPRRYLTASFEGEFTHIAHSPDVGMHMINAFEVDTAASYYAYQRFHQHWDQGLEDEVRLLADQNPDVVLANVPYRILAAANRAEIPAIALCNLNWIELYRHFCQAQTGADAVISKMLSAYSSARIFIQPTPCMPMSYLENSIKIGPIARIGKMRRTEICRLLGISTSSKLVLVSLGGVPTQLDLAAWPSIPDVHWLVPAVWNPRRRDMAALESLGMIFIDVLRSADALLTKPGYGSFVEAACNGTPVLFAPRVDWPEETFLVNWLQEHGRCLSIPRRQLEQGNMATALEALFSLPQRYPVKPSGIDDAVALITPILNEK